jgi:hypothetical protein
MVLLVLRTGRMRVLPIPDQRMMLWSFLGPPDANFKLQVRA